MPLMRQGMFLCVICIWRASYCSDTVVPGGVRILCLSKGRRPGHGGTFGSGNASGLRAPSCAVTYPHAPAACFPESFNNINTWFSAICSSKTTFS